MSHAPREASRETTGALAPIYNVKLCNRSPDVTVSLWLLTVTISTDWFLKQSKRFESTNWSENQNICAVSSSTPRMLLSHLWYLWVHFTIDCMHMHVQYIWEWAPTPIEWEWVGYITVWCAVDMIHGVHVATSGNATVMSHYFLSKIPVHTLLIFELSLCSNYKI